MRGILGPTCLRNGLNFPVPFSLLQPNIPTLNPLQKASGLYNS